VSHPRVSSFGLVDAKREKDFSKEIEDMLDHYLAHVKDSVLQNNRLLEDELRKTVRKHCIRKYKKYPLIVPTIIAQ
jgi:ribonuclease J